MLAHFARILTLLLFPSLVFAQSLDYSILSPTGNNGTSTFLVKDGELTVRTSGIRFLETGNTLTAYAALGISPDKSIVSVLKKKGDAGEIVILNSRGDTLNTFSSVMLGRSDPSLGMYPMNNGNVVLRDNITNFTFYNTLGKILHSNSFSSQTKGGEAISEVAMGADGRTLIIYNPKIKRGDQLGSKAQVKISGGEFKNIYHSTDRYIKDVNISDDGNIATLITAKEGTDDRVIIMDQYGNVLNTLTTDEDLIGASLSDDNGYISLYSGGRVMVYTLEGKRLGATSFRSGVMLADYFPEDNLILALTGNFSESSGILNNAGFRAINLEQREIASKKFRLSIGFTDAISPEFVRISSNEYELQGGSKNVSIRTDF